MTTTMEEREQEKEALAAEAAGRINKGQHWQDWLYVADGLAVGRDKAMRAAGTNAPYGRQYAKAFSEWLEARPWTRMIDKKTRADALWIIDHLPSVFAWRDALRDDVRSSVNHPTVARRKYEAHEASRRVAAADPAKSMSPMEKLKAEIVRLEEENLILRKRAAADGSLFDLRKDTARNIAATMASNVGLARLIAIQKEIAAEIARLKAVSKQAG